MPYRILFLLSVLLFFQKNPASAQNSAADFKNYKALREQIKELELPALRTMAADAHETNIKRGVASYYLFLKTLGTEPGPADAKKAIDALETATDAFVDPASCAKLAVIYSNDYPEYGVKRDLAKSLKYLSISWEVGDLITQATGDNGVLTLVLSNNLGLADGLFEGKNGNDPELKKALDAIRPDVLQAREHFKKLYGVTVKDDHPGSTGLEGHYAG